MAVGAFLDVGAHLGGGEPAEHGVDGQGMQPRGFAFAFGQPTFGDAQEILAGNEFIH